MKIQSSFRKCGFTLMETVIAIGVLAVLLTGFIIVFAPAAAGIKKSVNLQAADRLASALEQELVTLRKGQESATIITGFDKAFEWIKNSNAPAANDALLAYQYRGSLTARRDDGTPEPVSAAAGVPGVDYMVQSMIRRNNNAEFFKDLNALEGGVYMVKCTQFVFDADGKLVLVATPGQIKNPKPDSIPPDPNYKAGPFDKADDYPEAVIAFSADFYSLPQKSEAYFKGTLFADTYAKVKKPVFTRNLAARR